MRLEDGPLPNITKMAGPDAQRPRRPNAEEKRVYGGRRRTPDTFYSPSTRQSIRVEGRRPLTGGRHVDKVPEVAERFVRPRVHRQEDGVVGSWQCRDTSDRHYGLDGHLEELVDRRRLNPLNPVWSDMHLDDKREAGVVQWLQLMAMKVGPLLAERLEARRNKRALHGDGVGDENVEVAKRP